MVGREDCAGAQGILRSCRLQFGVACCPSYAELEELVVSQAARIAKLEVALGELRARVDRNSRNSSKPPSSDGYAKPSVSKDRSLRRRSGRKPGAGVEAQIGLGKLGLAIASTRVELFKHETDVQDPRLPPDRPGTRCVRPIALIACDR